MAYRTIEDLIDSLAHLASDFDKSHFIEESSPMFSSRRTVKPDFSKKTSEEKPSESPKNVPRYSIYSPTPQKPSRKVEDEIQRFSIQDTGPMAVKKEKWLPDGEIRSVAIFH